MTVSLRELTWETVQAGLRCSSLGTVLFLGNERDEPQVPSPEFMSSPFSKCIDNTACQIATADT